jgi:hypothetical protein
LQGGGKFMEKHEKREGLDAAVLPYEPRLNARLHEGWEDFLPRP